MRLSSAFACLGWAAALATALIAGVALLHVSSDMPLSAHEPPPAAAPLDAHHADERLALAGALGSLLSSQARKPLQTEAELDAALGVIAASGRRPARFLMFGVGRDAIAWAALNAGGRTVFLEDDDAWAKSVNDKLKASFALAPASVPRPTVHTVRYSTRLENLKADLERARSAASGCAPKVAHPHNCILLEGLPPEVWDGGPWDFIHVDAPNGFAPEKPGRVSSILAAASLAARSPRPTEVFVHDFERHGERKAAFALLGEANLVRLVDRLAHFRITPDAVGA